MSSSSSSPLQASRVGTAAVSEPVEIPESKEPSVLSIPHSSEDSPQKSQRHKSQSPPDQAKSAQKKEASSSSKQKLEKKDDRVASSSPSSSSSHLPIPDKYMQVDVAQQFGSALKTYYEREVKGSHATQKQIDGYLDTVKKSVRDSFIKHWTRNTRIMNETERNNQVPTVEKPVDESLRERIAELKKVAIEKAQRIIRYREQYPHKMGHVTQLHQQYTQEVEDIYARVLDVDGERNKALRDQCESASLSDVEAPRSNLDELLNRFIKDGTLVKDQMLDVKQKLEHTAMAMQTLLNNNNINSASQKKDSNNAGNSRGRSAKGSGSGRPSGKSKNNEKRSLTEVAQGEAAVEGEEEEVVVVTSKRKRQRRNK